MVGKVVSFDEKKGYGFLAVADEPKHFFCHWTAIIEMDGYKKLEKGQVVEFETGIGPTGRVQAENVRVLQEV
jgi:CspA family cold shock protein